MDIRKKVALCGVPGMNKSDIEKMETYIRKEYANLEFVFLGELVLDKEDLIKKCKDVEVLVSWDQEMDEEIYSSLNLRAYIAASAGYNAANVEIASKFNVVVSNAKGYCKEEVAIHTIMFILDFARRKYLLMPDVREGNWSLATAGKITRFSISTVGILGLGSIGSNVAKMLKGFGVRIIANDPFVSAHEMEKLGVESVDFETLLKESDYLTLHTPLLESTLGLIDLEAIKTMKSSAYIINTSRGQVINQEDLYFALTNGLIAGAGLDVIENEPPKERDKKLIELKNVLISPHSAYLSEESSDAQISITAKEVGRILRNEAPINLVNREILANLTWIEN